MILENKVLQQSENRKMRIQLYGDSQYFCLSDDYFIQWQGGLNGHVC